MALYRSPLDRNDVAFIVFEEVSIPMIPPAHKAHQTVSFFWDVTVLRHTLVDYLHPNAAVLFVDGAIQPEVHFIAK
ncbi:hypothetical protein TNCV_4322651 [Trichonephila clavipes]|nr:hypothetical protein TNCV_4322651 [Trichonephila clavipes]